MINAAKKEGGGPRSEALPKIKKPDIFRHRGDYVVRFRRSRLLTDPYVSISSASAAGICLLSALNYSTGMLQFTGIGIVMSALSAASIGVAGYYLWAQRRRGHEVNQIRINGNILITAEGTVLSRHELHDFYITEAPTEDDPEQFKAPSSKRSRHVAVRAKYGSLRKPVTLVRNVMSTQDAEALASILNGWKTDEEAIAQASTGLHGKPTLLDK